MTADLLHIGSLGYLARLCRRWCGKIVFMPHEAFRSLPYNAPDTDGLTRSPDMVHAIDWPNRKVIAVDHRHNVGAIIHEMGHLFLEEGRPSATEEFDWLGWEIVLARRARCYRVWDKQNAEFVLNLEGRARSWGDLARSEKARLAADRIDHAQAIGIVSKDGEPLCTRKA